ncbi:hypothetical protein [Nocardia sp. NPDC058705]|uniref:hypothetical protein n=1 Tax=Nocardia sp. NPDC058705 TaxID=3346609 RepID=UPI00368877DE
MADRIGVVSALPPDNEGRRLLLLDDGRSRRIEPGLTDDEIKTRFDLDLVIHAPRIPFCAGLLLDGPLAGTRNYTVNKLGNRAIYYLPPPPADDIPRPRQPGLVYEVVMLGVDGKPAELRYVTSAEVSTASGCPTLRRRPE